MFSGNKRGAGLMFAIITGIMIFTAGMLIANFLKDDVTTTRDVTQMDCTNSSISDGAKLTCLGADIAVPFWIGIIIASAFGAITAKLLL